MLKTRFVIFNTIHTQKLESTTVKKLRLRPLISFIALGLICFLLSHRAEANNGLKPIGVTPTSQAMGGTGVAHISTPLTAISKNPSLMSFIQNLDEGELGAEAVLGYTDLQAQAMETSATRYSDQAGSALLPQLGFMFRHSTRVVYDDPTVDFGFAIITPVDHQVRYDATSALDRLKVALSVVKIVPSVAYRATEWLSIGFSPILSVGQFELNEGVGGSGPSTRPSAQDYGSGFMLGASAKFSKVTLGLTYQTPISYDFENAFDIDEFGSNNDPTEDTLSLEFPEEIAFGASLELNRLAFTGDIRYIAWRHTRGFFKELDWQDQTVLSLGTRYAFSKNLSWMLGYNYAKTPIRNISSQNGDETVRLSNREISKKNRSLINGIGFPVFTEHHFTTGFSILIADNTSLDWSFIVAPRSDSEQSGSSSAGDFKFTQSSQFVASSLGFHYWF